MADLTWPADLGFATVQGRVLYMEGDTSDPDRAPDVRPAAGTVTLTLSVKQLTYTGAEGTALFVKRTTQGVIDGEGYVCTPGPDGTASERGLIVPATDSALLSPTDFTYQVTIKVDTYSTVFSIKAPAGAVVDLAASAPVASSGGTAVVVDTTTAERAEEAATRAEAAADAAEGWTPSFEWDGTSLVVNGGDPVNLKGDTPTWADLPGKPASFPSTIPDVQGLAERLATLEYDSGRRNIAALFPAEVAVLQASIQRVGRTVTLAWGARFPEQPTGSVVELLTLPVGFRPPSPILAPWEQAAQARSSGRVFINSSGGAVTSYLSTQQTGWCYYSVTYVTPDPIPTVPFGDPS